MSETLEMAEVMVENDDGFCDWFHPEPNHLMKCCDCGLVHKMQFAITNPNHVDFPLNEGESVDSVIVLRASRLDKEPHKLKPQMCIAAPGEAGDCYRACLATVTGIPIRRIPNFCAEIRGRGQPDDMAFCAEVRDFLAPHGLAIFNTYCPGHWPLEKALDYFSGFNVGVPIILTGRPAYHTDPAHSVVALNGEIVHDPSGAGITGPAGDNWFFDVVALRAGVKP